MKPGLERLHSILVATNLRLGMPDKDALKLAVETINILTRHFGGEAIYICKPDDNQDRDKQIISMRENGVSVRNIAHSLSIPRSTVQEVIDRNGLTGVRRFLVKPDA